MLKIGLTATTRPGLCPRNRRNVGLLSNDQVIFDRDLFLLNSFLSNGGKVSGTFVCSFKISIRR